MAYDTIQQRINRGYGQAAAKLGRPCLWYRPTGPFSPISPGNLLGTLPVSMSTDAAFKFNAGVQYGKPLRYALVDGNQVQTGDYLLDGASRTWFLADMPLTLPITAVACNRTISVTRPTSASGVGFLDYSGDMTETPVLTNWPASVLQGTRGEKGEMPLPGDTRLPWWAILLPAFPGAQIKAFDVMTDDAGQHYKIASTELTELGWRLTASLAQS